MPLLGEGIFFSANSDTIVVDGRVPAVQRLLQAWRDGEMDALLLVHPVAQTIGYDGPGDFFITDDGVIRRRGNEAQAPFVFTGMQLIHPRLFDASPDGAFSLNVLYNRGMDEDGTLPRIRALVHDGNWLHVGDPQGLKQAEDFLKKAVN